MNLKRVIIESPYSGGGQLEKQMEHFAYLERCLRDSLPRGEAPFASHGFYTIFLDDDSLRDRDLGMKCGWAWMALCDFVAVYIDYDNRSCMLKGIEEATELGKVVEYRKIGKNKPRIDRG